MSQYLAPGVFVEEIRLQPSQIQPASTSVGGMVGPALFGPIGGPPQLLTSFNDFTTYFGGPGELQIQPTANPNNITPLLNHCAYAVQMFFDNGGQQLYFSRTAYNAGMAPGASYLSPSTATCSVGTPGSGSTQASWLLSLTARFPGSGGNLDLTLTPRRSAPLLATAPATNISTGPNYLLQVMNPPLSGAAFANFSLPSGLTAIGSLTAIVTHSPAVASSGATPATPEQYVFVPGTPFVFTDQNGMTNIQTVPATGAPAPAAGTLLGTGVLPAGVTPPATLSVLSASVKTPASAGSGPVFSIPIGPIMRNLLNTPSTMTTLYATLSGSSFVASTSFNPTLTANITAPLGVLAMGGRPGDGGIYYDSYDVAVQSNGVTIFTAASVDLDSGGANSFSNAFPAKPTGSAAATQPIAAAYDGSPKGSDIWPLLMGGTSTTGGFDRTALIPTAPGVAPAFVMHLRGGYDGALPEAVDYSGDDAPGCGLSAFESVDEISIVFCPSAAAADSLTHQAVIMAMIAHCKKMVYRVAVIDSPPGAGISDMQTFVGTISDDRTALYYPWVTVASLDPNGGTVSLPPSSFVAGLYADTDVARGVFKAPANVVVQDALALETSINTAQQETLNPIGVNCLRQFTWGGFRVWGARTLSSDSQWKYVNVRRYFLYLEHSIANSTSWVVFEPNGQQLWSQVAAMVGDFLYSEWKAGHLFGATPAEAYFVSCDQTTMTQADIDNGQLICVIGVAPLEPAEFVIFRIGQYTASASS